MRIRVMRAAVSLLLCIGCGGADGAPVGPDDDNGDNLGDENSIPPPGPNWTVSPIPIEKLARITPLGHNNKILPIGHTYWDTCDIWWLMPSGRPCVRERLPVRAPGDGVVFLVEHGEDGGISIEGPPGLIATFAHVSPDPSLRRGDTVSAGDTVAIMTYEHSFDFGVTNNRVTPPAFVRPDRIPRSYAHAQHPIAQFPEPLRSEMIARVQTQEDPLGRLNFDVAGTAAGMWFLPGTPAAESFSVDYVQNQLFLGRLQERNETRIMITGSLWPAQINQMSVIDSSAQSWDEITPSSGIVALKAWFMARDGGPDTAQPHGTVLIEMLDDDGLRIEWFATHDPVTSFTAAARIYER